MSLARDALASGDMITAESYLQHAEHYNRIIMAAQQQLGPHGAHQGEGPNGGGYRPRFNPDGADDEGGSDFDATDGGGGEGREARGGGGQDRERHTGNREHHGGGRERRSERGNGRGAGHEANGAESAEAQAADEPAPDQVS